MAEERLEEIRQKRLAKRQALLDAGQIPYPSEVRRTHTIAEALEQFNELRDDSVPLVLIGRLTSLRTHGALVFADLADQSATIQLQIARDNVDPDIFDRLEYVDTGDWLQATGTLTVTKRNEQTLNASEFHIISKSIRPLPDSWYGLKDHEMRYRQRELDLLLNTDTRRIFERRTQIITWLRQYLTGQKFFEVETPILQHIAGGAAAKPFITHHNALDTDLFLRIAPELYLKRLTVGGMEKVFEIGKNFRNEGISREHNPEFTMLELYWAYTDYEDLMSFTEDMLEQLVRELSPFEAQSQTERVSSTDVTWRDTTISFDKPFRRERYTDLVSERAGIDILKEKNPAVYEGVYKKEGLQLPAVRTYSKLVDELYKELVRPTLIQPTLVYDYPVEMAPLAKQNLTHPAVAEKFQLLVGGTELVNAYTELNDPVEQRKRFEEQQKARQAGDEEAHAIDEAYLRAMEYGMPPVGGYGLGIDRLTMIVTNAPTIRDTILFPLLKPKQERR